MGIDSQYDQISQQNVETENQRMKREYMEYRAPLLVVGKKYNLVKEVKSKDEDGNNVVDYAYIDLSIENEVLYGDLKKYSLDESSKSSLEKNLLEVRNLWEVKKKEISALESELEQLRQDAVILGQKMEEEDKQGLLILKGFFDPRVAKLHAQYKEKEQKLKDLQTGSGFGERHWRERIAVLEAILSVQK